jgi:1-acyl-sn-glycerol-3-phosphate acyltransferase
VTRPKGQRLRFYVGFLLGGLWFLACSAAGLLHCVLVPGADHVHYFTRIFCRKLAAALGWNIVVSDPKQFASSIPCVFVANHQSIVDIITFGAIVPGNTVAVAKKGVGWIPLFGWLFVAAGDILIDRENPDKAHRSLEKAAGVIRRRGIAVWMMPEGHRNVGPTLLRFKSGAFRLAAAAGVPIVPVVSAPLRVIVDTRNRRAEAGTLRVRVLDPIPVPPDLSKEALAELADSIRRKMQAAFDELAAVTFR